MRLLVYEYCSVQSAADPAGLALLDEGWGMLRALVEDLSQAGHHLAVLASPALEPSLRPFPGVEVVVTAPENDLEELSRWAPRVEGSLVVAPEFRGLLAERVEAVLAAGGRALNCSPAAIRLAADKRRVADHFASAAASLIAFPATEPWRPDFSLADRHWAAAVLKPTDGAGSQATTVVHSDADLHRAVAGALRDGWPDLVVQPYHGDVSPASVCVLAGEQSVVLPPTGQVLSADGRFHYLGASYPLPPDQRRAAADLAGALLRWFGPGLRGWVGLDVGLAGDDDGRDDVCFDVNPRLTTSYLALRQRCRGNLADALVRVALGGRCPPLEWDETPLEFRL